MLARTPCPRKPVQRASPDGSVGRVARVLRACMIRRIRRGRMQDRRGRFGEGIETTRRWRVVRDVGRSTPRSGGLRRRPRSSVVDSASAAGSRRLGARPRSRPSARRLGLGRLRLGLGLGLRLTASGSAVTASASGSARPPARARARPRRLLGDGLGLLGDGLGLGGRPRPRRPSASALRGEPRRSALPRPAAGSPARRLAARPRPSAVSTRLGLGRPRRASTSGASAAASGSVVSRPLRMRRADRGPGRTPRPACCRSRPRAPGRRPAPTSRAPGAAGARHAGRTTAQRRHHHRRSVRHPAPGPAEPALPRPASG